MKETPKITGAAFPAAGDDTSLRVPTPRPLCIYHKNCLDGSGAAAVVARKVPDCEFLAVQYSNPPPKVEGRSVYLVDFGFPLEAMRQLKAQASDLLWIDHHASAEDIWRTLGWGVFDLDECGTSLTWKTLFPSQPPPPVVQYIRDKDLWRWELPDSRVICAGLVDAYPNSLYAGLLEADLTAMAARGRPLIEAQRQRVVEAAKSGVAINDAYGVKGLRALAVNCFKDQNELGEYICQPLAEGGLGYDLAVLFYRKGNAPMWVHSLRSGARAGLPTADCATIAAARGGGGHPSSSCYLSKEPLIPPPTPPLTPPTAPAAP